MVPVGWVASGSYFVTGSDKAPAAIPRKDWCPAGWRERHPLIREVGIFRSVAGGTGGVDFIGQIVPFAGNFLPGGAAEDLGSGPGDRCYCSRQYSSTAIPTCRARAAAYPRMIAPGDNSVML